MPRNKIKKENIKRYNKKYRETHLEEIKLKQNKYYENNKDKIKQKRKKYYNDNREKCLEISRRSNKKYNIKAKNKISKKNAIHYKKTRLEMFNILGGAKCCMCGYNDYRALQIDHTNGDGYIKRKIIRSYKGQLKDIIKNKSSYQVLCANCNWIKKYDNKEEHYANKKKQQKNT